MGSDQEEGDLQTLRTKAATGSLHYLFSAGRKMLIRVQTSRLNRLVCYWAALCSLQRLILHMLQRHMMKKTPRVVCVESK